VILTITLAFVKLYVKRVCKYGKHQESGDYRSISTTQLLVLKKDRKGTQFDSEGLDPGNDDRFMDKVF